MKTITPTNHKKLKIFIICTVRKASLEYTDMLFKYVKGLEDLGHTVHLPPRDTNQIDDTGFNICTDNFEAILNSDEVHIFYNPDSQGTHFDLGMVFAIVALYPILETKIKIVPIELPEFKPGKNFPNMILEWQKRQ